MLPAIVICRVCSRAFEEQHVKDGVCFWCLYGRKDELHHSCDPIAVLDSQVVEHFRKTTT